MKRNNPLVLVIVHISFVQIANAYAAQKVQLDRR